MERLFWSILIICCSAMPIFSQTFTAKNAKNIDLSYSVTSSVTKTCELVGSQTGTPYTGSIEVPATTNYDGTIYDVNEIGSAAFFLNKGVTSISLPASVSILDEACFRGASALAEFIVDDANEYYSAQNGVLFNKDVTTLLSYPMAITSSLYVIPSTVTKLDTYCFYNCDNLKTVQMPVNLKTISDAAFFDCTGLTSMDIPATVDSIGVSAFYDCTALTELVVEISKPLTISEYVFSGVDKSKCTLYVPQGSIDAYKAAPIWSEFLKISAIDSTVGTAKINSDNPVTEIYDLRGGKRNTELPLESGIYIVKTGNKVSKVIIRR